MEFIHLPHSIKSKDENGRILAEILFPEHTQGIYTIERTYVAEEYLGTGVAEQLVDMAVEQIRRAHGKIEATCPFARKYLKEKRIL